MRRAKVLGLSLAILVVGVPVAVASHRWNGYHWYLSDDDRQLTLRIGLRDDSNYRRPTQDAAWEWGSGTRIDYDLVEGDTNCDPPSKGEVKVCEISADGDGRLEAFTFPWVTSQGHITRMLIKLEAAGAGWSYSDRRRVVCHELGHALGLGHRADGSRSCMSPSIDTAFPDGHDKDMVDYITHRH